MNNQKFHQVSVGNVVLDQHHYVIQSMTNTKTSNVSQTLSQIKQLHKLGCELVRIAITNTADIKALPKLIKNSPCPLIGDIQYDLNLAIQAINQGIAAIRINPGNTPFDKSFINLLNKAKTHHATIRLGINTGSLPAGIKTDNQILNLLKKYVNFCEKHQFYDIVLSIKSSDIDTTIRLNQKLAKSFNYPIHLGLTEAGTKTTSIIRSTLALAPLIKKHIGSTIRISITPNPIDEPIVAKQLLHNLGCYPKLTHVITCPTCGRTHSNYFQLIDELIPFIELHPIENFTVAIMGCAVNGINEAKNAQLGIFCNQNLLTIYHNQQIMGNFSYSLGIKKFQSLYLKYERTNSYKYNKNI